MAKRFFALSLAALISLSLLGCGKEKPTSPATGQVKVGANDASGKGPSAPKGATIKFEGVVVALYNGSSWITLNQGSPATVTVTMSDSTLQMAVNTPVSVEAGTYTKVRLQFSGISSSTWGGASIDFGGAASVTIEAAANIQVSGNATVTIVVDINTNKWLDANGALTATTAIDIKNAFTVSVR
ncbi:DUF4382 domain-containing protein [candidate division TA06 bacterium]|uniref:DUF4382 domain-containing protein n=1 Tax=candidate division TA06 bacterium TaxID=2250710 RepID=A0A933IAK7_UNCT6|nr:DUF4382 domain-containing protein [candidate division TA06 bacterium]